MWFQFFIFQGVFGCIPSFLDEASVSRKLVRSIICPNRVLFFLPFPASFGDIVPD